MKNSAIIKYFVLEGGKKEYEEKQDNISGTKLSQNRSENYHQILLLCLAGMGKKIG